LFTSRGVSPVSHNISPEEKEEICRQIDELLFGAGSVNLWKEDMRKVIFAEDKNASCFCIHCNIWCGNSGYIGIISYYLNKNASFE